MDEMVRAAVDIGSASVKVVVGRVEVDRLVVLGCGEAFHDGAREGVITSFSEIIEALNTAIEEAEVMSSTIVERVYAGLGGQIVSGMHATARIPIGGRDFKVRKTDVACALRRCTEIDLPNGIRPMDVVPGRFSLDGHSGLVNPVGMIGKELEAHAFVVLTETRHADLLAHAINQASAAVLAVTHEALAASDASLTPDEKDLGCLLIDIGHASSEWIVWRQNMIMATGSIPIGGWHFTADLVAVLKTTTEGAEKIKRVVPAIPDSEGIEFLGVEVPEIGTSGDKIVSGLEAAEVLFERAGELMTEIAAQICHLELESCLGGGIVLVGGGAKLDGLPVVAERVFAQQTRIGIPRNISGESEPVASPRWAVGCGLLRCANRQMELQGLHSARKTGLKDRFKRFFNEVFD